jgi:hypothetical protein
MNMPQPYHAAYVLWLIRGGRGTKWSDLCAHFGMDPGDRLTQHAMLCEALKSLLAAGLIHADGNLESLLTGPNDPSFSVTPLLSQLQSTLKLSLSDLATSDPYQRLIINPILQKTFSSRYKSDIFVVMPFAPQLAPVYEDHLKAVAKKLGMSIARADDFFTGGNMMDEIWTALIDAKLVIADCTGRNPNVFYEICLADAIGKPTVLITQRSDDVPFDLRYRRYLKYEVTPRGMKTFEQQLSKTIKTTLDEESLPT